MLFCFIGLAAAQSSEDPVEVSPSSLVLVVKEGDSSEVGRLHFVGLADKYNVQLFTSDLIDNKSGSFIQYSDITLSDDNFDLNRNSIKDINVTVRTQDLNIGNYRGTLLTVFTTPGQNATIVPIDVTLRVGSAQSFFGGLMPSSWNTQSWSIIIIIALSIIGYLYGERVSKFGTPVVVIISITIAAIWIYTVVNFTFNEINTIISTALIAPFLTYSANYLNDKRTQKNSKESAALTVFREGIKEDIDLIRKLMGELATHYASFNPYQYAKINGNNIDISSPEILYNKNGKLGKTVWVESCKQGKIADLPIPRIENYYDFVDIYNRYYSCARFMTTGKEGDELKKIKEGDLLQHFTIFRAAYAKLQENVFVNLSYYIGAFTKNNMAPLNNEFPRVNRPLLKKLVKYGIFLEVPKRFQFSYKTKLDETGKEKLIKRIDNWKFNASELDRICNVIYSKGAINKFYHEVSDDFTDYYVKLVKAAKVLLSDSIPEDFLKNEEESGKENEDLKNLLEKLVKNKKVIIKIFNNELAKATT